MPDGQVETVITWSAPTATDNSEVSTITVSHVSGTTVFEEGWTEVVATATDIVGIESTCSFYVNVIGIHHYGSHNSHIEFKSESNIHRHNFGYKSTFCTDFKLKQISMEMLSSYK